jgi:LexA-binding, inner membrane-associated putative hydrolase
MAPGTHAFIGWWTANIVPLSRRDRLVVFLAEVLPDLDGLGLLFSSEAYLTYHHVLCHNLVGCILWTILVAVLSQQPRPCATLAFLNWHLHLACDYFGSGGANGSVWPLAYLYPFIGVGAADACGGPAWYWNRWQWPLNGWPNLVTTLVAFIGFLYIAVRRDRTFFEFLCPPMDQIFCRTLRKWFGGQPAEQWSEKEALFIRRSFLVVTIIAFFACAVAGSATAYLSRSPESSSPQG